MQAPPGSASSCELADETAAGQAGPRSGNRSLQKRRACPGRRPHKARIPIAERGSQGPPQRSELGDPGVEQLQFSGKQRACLPARDASPISFIQEQGQLRDRDAEGERAPDELHAVPRGNRIRPVSVRRARRRLQQSLSLVVAKRVGADSGPCRERSSSQRTSALIHGSHPAPWNQFQGQGLPCDCPVHLVSESRRDGAGGGVRQALTAAPARQPQELEGFATILPAREIRIASVSSGRSSMKRGRAWPAKARAAMMTEGKRGRLMCGSRSLGSREWLGPRERTCTPSITRIGESGCCKRKA